MKTSASSELLRQSDGRGGKCHPFPERRESSLVLFGRGFHEMPPEGTTCTRIPIQKGHEKSSKTLKWGEKYAGKEG